MSHSSLIATSLWRAQCLLHSNNNVALPAVLLSSAGVLLLYRHMTESVDGHDDLKTFLALIVIQMVPLLLLEMRIMAVKDPVAMLSKFGSKVMLMHASFLVLRLVVQGFDEVRSAMCNAAGLFAFVGVAVVHFNVRLSVKSFNANLSVIVLIAVAAIGALLFEIVDSYTRGRGIVYSKTFKVLVLSTTSDYIEILGFVPAVWMVYRGVDTSCDDTGEGDRNAAAGFFLRRFGFFLLPRRHRRGIGDCVGIATRCAGPHRAFLVAPGSCGVRFGELLQSRAHEGHVETLSS